MSHERKILEDARFLPFNVIKTKESRGRFRRQLFSELFLASRSTYRACISIGLTRITLRATFRRESYFSDPFAWTWRANTRSFVLILPSGKYCRGLFKVALWR